MKKFLFLIFFSFIYAANLINVDFFEDKDKVDILFSLDKKFDGKIIKLAKNKFFFKNIISDKVIQKSFNNFFIKSIIITPSKEGVLLKIDSKEKFNLSVALTPDEYGIRVRIKSLKARVVKPLILPQKETFSFTRYFIVVAILIILAIILLIIKKRVNNSFPILKNDMKILSQKFIDAKNKVVLFEYQNRKYLMLIGNTNILLDVFDENFKSPKNEVEFEEMLKIHNKLSEIEKYIQKADNIKELDERI